MTPLERAIFPQRAMAPLLAAVGYFVGSMLGLSLAFPGTEVSVVWLPNAILLAALLVTPRRRWWECLLAVAPAHFLAQGLMGIPLRAELINFVGNTGDALLGALMIGEVLARRQRRDRLEAVIVIMILGGIVAPAVMSLLVAELFAAIGSTTDPWLNWSLRLLTNTLAVFTVVPPIVLDTPRLRPVALRRRGEAVTLFIGLGASSLLLFALPQASSSPLLLYLPLPFLLWAAMRFGLVGACASVLTLAAISTWSVVQGRGPFTAIDPVENATFFVLFLLVICAPLVLLGALLEEREGRERERRTVATLHGAVLASMRDEIAVLDRDGVILEVNESWGAAGRAAPGSSYVRELERAAEHGVDRSAERMLDGARSVLRGERSHFQTELPAPEGDGRWFEMSAEGLKRPEGGAVITHADVSARKLAEEETRRQRQELAHLTRVAMLGELSGSLAHELNQPLTAILTNAQAGQRLMKNDPVNLGELRDILDDIADADRRAGEVIHRLRAMLKKGDTRRAPLAVNDLVAEVLHFTHGDLITRKVTVTTRLAPRLQRVLGDPVQLQQVLLNLVLNGCEAMSANAPAERQLAIVTGNDSANTLRVAVVDRGGGISADPVERIFEPFFTTKEHGLGLGLSICRSIVASHGGRLSASNNADRGATLSFTLPAVDDTER